VYSPFIFLLDFVLFLLDCGGQIVAWSSMNSRVSINELCSSLQLPADVVSVAVSNIHRDFAVSTSRSTRKSRWAIVWLFRGKLKQSTLLICAPFGATAPLSSNQRRRPRVFQKCVALGRRFGVFVAITTEDVIVSAIALLFANAGLAAAINSVVVWVAGLGSPSRKAMVLVVWFTVRVARSADVHPVISHTIGPQHWRPIVRDTASAIHWSGALAVRTDLVECAELLSLVGTTSL